MIPGINGMKAQEYTPVTADYVIGGKKITFETGKLAQLINGSVVIKDEEGNYLLTTVGLKKGMGFSADFFPLSVDYQERYYATGKIGGSRFRRREGRPGDESIITSRLIDRPIRPMFPKNTRNEVQIIPTILSSTGESDFGFWGITGASLSILLAGVTAFEGPVAGVKFALVDNTFVFDPTFEQLKNAQLQMLLAGTKDAITMVEFQGNEATDEQVMSGFEYGHKLIGELCDAQLDFVAKYKKVYDIEEFELTLLEEDTEGKEAIQARVTDAHIASLYGLGKVDFHHKLEEIEEEIFATMEVAEEDEKDTKSLIADAVYSRVKKAMRKEILTNKKRLDGRAPADVRPVRAEPSFLPRAHGSVWFQRGITSSLSVATLGGPDSVELVDGMYKESERRYMHHYNFPPYSVGEVRPMRGVGRREIGHGNLAEKALIPVLPSEEEFPYVVRVVSEITTCNGSSSMAAVCGSSLSLMDAGVPIKNIVTGVAMGMIYDETTNEYVILSDIQAQEDFLGDLDFKVAGTQKGITALQMDTKIEGLSLDTVREVLTQSKAARDFIETGMTGQISAPRAEVSKYAPALISFMIPEEKIREVIGKGGETIQGITKDFGVEINIADDGLLTITAPSNEDGKKAEEYIKDMIKELEVGAVQSGTVVKILDGVGAIVDLGKGKSGMIHISKLSKARVAKVEDVVKEKDEVLVKILAIDVAKWRVSLQRIEEEKK